MKMEQQISTEVMSVTYEYRINLLRGEGHLPSFLHNL